MTAGWDVASLLLLNSLADESAYLNRVIAAVAASHSLKALPLVLLLTGFWFVMAERQNRRAAVIAGFGGGILAVLVTRLVQNFGPHRPRPFEHPAVDFNHPTGLSEPTLAGWSSFPSDTASLLFALATGVFLAHRRFGLLALVWAGVVGSLPRVYLGFHFPSDILVGAAIGAGAVVLVYVTGLPRRLAIASDRVMTRYPSIFYPAALAFVFQVTTMFDDARRLGTHLLNPAPTTVSSAPTPPDAATISGERE